MTYAALFPWLVLIGVPLGTVLVLAAMVLLSSRDRCAVLHGRYHERCDVELVCRGVYRIHWCCFKCFRSWTVDEVVAPNEESP